MFVGHLLAFLFPGWILSLNSNPLNQVIFELLGFIFGLGTLLGLAWLFIRRISNARVQMVTNRMDIVIELLIIAQAALGCWIAFSYRWGSSWFASDLTPYLWSILALNPQTAAVTALPSVVLTHVVVAFFILALIPFTRLVHFLVEVLGIEAEKTLWKRGLPISNFRLPDPHWGEAKAFPEGPGTNYFSNLGHLGGETKKKASIPGEFGAKLFSYRIRISELGTPAPTRTPN